MSGIGQIKTILPAKNMKLPSSILSAVTLAVSVITLGILSRYWFRNHTKFVKKKHGRKLLCSACRRNQVTIKPSANVISFTLPDVVSLVSCSVSGNGTDVQLTPQQIGAMGMEALETSITYWEDALNSLSKSADVLTAMSHEETEFYLKIQKLLDTAYKLQDQCECLFPDQEDIKLNSESVISERLKKHSTDESFASAQDYIADLHDFDECSELFDSDRPLLYKAALKHFEENGIPYRSLRTTLVNCDSDADYLIKLHCIRSAFQLLFLEPSKRTWFADIVQQILSDLLSYGDKDPKEFVVAYQEMLNYIQVDDNLKFMEKELAVRNVKLITFYDVALDYILLDAFADLESPPSSIVSVVQNRWLSNGFKETALTTAVWSVLKAKRRMLKYPDGFRSRFYAISEHIIPFMAWGFLGPNESLREICQYFKDEMISFFIDIYDTRKCRYTTVEDLSTDVFHLLETRVNNISTKLMRE